MNVESCDIDKNDWQITLNVGPDVGALLCTDYSAFFML